MRNRTRVHVQIHRTRQVRADRNGRLGFATVAWGVLLPFLPELPRPAVEGASGRPIPIPVGLTSATLEFVLTIAALVGT